MLKINMVNLLLTSLSSKDVLQKRKRFTLEKNRFTVFYTVDGPNLLIKNIKHMSKVQKREKRRELLMRSHRIVKFNAKNIAAEHVTEISFQKCNSSTQTEFETIESSSDTYDLCEKLAKCQQTNETTICSQYVQTLPLDLYSLGTQTVCETAVASSQTDYFFKGFSTTPLDGSTNGYLNKLAECQDNQSDILNNINKMLEDLGTLIEINCDNKFSDVRDEMCDMKFTLLESVGELEINLARRDKKHLRSFFRKCSAAADNRVIITELNSQGTQTDISQSKQTKAKKRQSIFCRCM